MTDPATLPADLERMAREAGMGHAGAWWKSQGADMDVHASQLARFAELVRADALERAAKVCAAVYAERSRTFCGFNADEAEALEQAAAAIRALKDKP